MIIEHTGKMFREMSIHDHIAKVDSNPQLWQFKNFADAATLGTEIVWPYEDYLWSDPIPDGLKFEILSNNLVAFTFPVNVKIKENFNLFIFPHYMKNFDSNMPLAIPQIIEADWWPKQLRILFYVEDAVYRFRKGIPFAQAVTVARREHTIKEMEEKDVKQQKEASDFIDSHANEYITRRIDIPGFALQDNLYERLAELNKSDSLPEDIKKKNNDPKPRLRWQ